MNTSTEFVKLRTTLTSRPAMKSVRFHGRGDVRVDEVEEPVCGKGQVKVRLTPLLQVMVLMNPSRCDRPTLGSVALVSLYSIYYV